MPRTALAEEDVKRRLLDVDGWSLADGGKAISREWRFEDYAHGVLFVNAIAHLAEQHDHHPDVGLGYGYVRVSITTHDAGGLTDADFRLAADVDRLPLTWYVER